MKQCETQRGSARQWVPGSIHQAMPTLVPAGTRRLDAGPSFGSASCHNRGGTVSESWRSHRRWQKGRVFVANDRQFHGVMRKDMSARSRDSRHGLGGVRVGEASIQEVASAAHVLQGLTELNPRTTVTSIVGVSAYDMTSRRSMLDGLCQVEGGHATLPFVAFRPDAEGEVHSIAQGEGGEQGIP